VFEWQLDYLLDKWKVLPAMCIEEPDREGIILSFDDGMLNGWETVAPLLRERGITAIFAVCPGLLSGRIHHVWRDHVYLIVRAKIGDALWMPMNGYREPLPLRDADVDAACRALLAYVRKHRIENVYDFVRELSERNGIAFGRMDHFPSRFTPMTWDMVRDLRSQGHVIASHSMTHRILSLLTAAEKQTELTDSREQLEQQLSESVQTLVYPYGGPTEVDGEAIELASKCGYRHAFLNVPQPLPGPSSLCRPRFSLPAEFNQARMHVRLSGLEHFLRGLT
jgi:peptidoglycan/xylan/chitin deacetylase (PgdA/CDA1 family)